MDTQKKPKVGFVPCLTMVKQGVAKPKMEKLKPSKEEMKRVVKELRLREAEYQNRPKDDQESLEGEPMSETDATAENNTAIDDYYDMENYDDEPVESGMSYNTDAMILNNLPESDSEDSEEEVEEFTVKPDDNIVVAGQVSDDVCMLQLYVLNVEKQEFFLLNDTYLPSYPVAVEWLDFNPKDASATGHFAAVGYMEPEIHVWDLNVSDCLEPAFTLGSKKQKKSLRHRDAVMDLAWNRNARNVLASSSADNTVILWDMNECKSVTRLENFTEKVQTVNWHPVEPQSLLTGVCDGSIKLFDCRSSDTSKMWNFEGEIERVLWNQFDPFQFFVSTEKGTIHCVDIRGNAATWNLKAHDSAVGGLALSSHCGDMLVTGSQDESAKVWDIKDGKPSLVKEKQMHIGHIYVISACPDSPYVYAAGGAKADNHLYIWDARDSPEVVERFQDRVRTVGPGGSSASVSMEDDSNQVASSSSSFQFTQKSNPTLAGSSKPSTSANSSAATAKQSVKSDKKKKKKK